MAKETLIKEEKKIAINLNISFIDINNEVFKKEINPLKLLLFEWHGYYNVDGYKKKVTLKNL